MDKDTKATGAAQHPAQDGAHATKDKASVGNAGELHQTAGGSHPSLTTNQGLPVSDNQNSLPCQLPRADSARRLHPPRKDYPLRSRAHSRAHRARARLGSARLLRAHPLPVGLYHRQNPYRSRGEDAPVYPLFDCRGWRRISRTRRAMCGASRSSSTPRKGTGIWLATTSRCSSSRTRSSFPI